MGAPETFIEEATAKALNRVDGETGRVFLVVRVEMRPMVGLAGFDVHPDYDSVEPRKFRHRPTLASSSPGRRLNINARRLRP